MAEAAEDVLEWQVKQPNKVLACGCLADYRTRDRASNPWRMWPEVFVL